MKEIDNEFIKSKIIKFIEEENLEIEVIDENIYARKANDSYVLLFILKREVQVTL